MNYDELKTKVNSLIGDWKELLEKSKFRRDKRTVDIDIQKERASGNLEEDETMIIIRRIHTNIERAKPRYMQYLRGVDRLALFSVQGDPTVDTRNLEVAFTQGMMYEGWMQPFESLVDGSLLHGWDAVEVSFDAEKPFGFSIDHIGNDRLLFPTGAEKLEYCDLVAISFNVSKSWLATNKKFDQEVVSKIISEKKEKDKEEFFTIYKVFTKVNGVVQVCWISITGDNYLRIPENLYLGRNSRQEIQAVGLDGLMTMEVVETPIAETKYPIFLYDSHPTEEKQITKRFGGAFLDYPMQEAMTALWSATVNGAVRSTNITVARETASGGKLALEDITITSGSVVSEPMKILSPPPPDPMLLATANALDVQNSADQGQVAFAAQNRKDSRKTATEINAATQEQQISSFAEIAHFSSAFLQPLWSFCWELVQNRWNFGFIQFANVDEGFKQARILVSPAGERDVIERDKKLMMLRQDLPTLVNLPIGKILIQEYLSLAYPHDAKKFEKFMLEESQAKMIVSSLIQLIGSSMDRNLVAQLPPERQQELTGIIQQANAFVAS